ncbi:MAG: hypothetical protein ABIN94_20215 [Ferruginibacter sp.]
MTENNQNEGKEQPSLATAESPDTSGFSTSQTSCCEEILRRLDQGLPVVLTGQIADISGKPEFQELDFINKFIKRLGIDFIAYRSLMDSILFTRYSSQPAPGTGSIKVDPRVEITSEENIMLGNSLFSSTHAYRLLKYATEKYLRIHYGLSGLPTGEPGDIIGDTLPYIRLVEAKLERCLPHSGALSSDISIPKAHSHYKPVFIELIWSYWHEEGMVYQTINAIARRFQNFRNGQRDPLANLEIGPLRPLNNILWGYIQDAPNRLSPMRFAYECMHHYGIKPATANPVAPADSRSYFIQAFHNLLNKCALFYREADNLIKVADALPVLNALREVHMQLAEGAHNQFGDLPLASRAQMMIEQYMLSRQEIKEFLGGREMVPTDEPWMDRVDIMKSLQGWNRASVTYFHDLAEFGEQIILSIRWISWSQVNNRNIARAWALLFRDEIQRYIHCYHAVTGVDLSVVNVSGAANDRSLMPAVLIRRKLQRDMMIRRR